MAGVIANFEFRFLQYMGNEIKNYRNANHSLKKGFRFGKFPIGAIFSIFLFFPLTALEINSTFLIIVSHP
jgi:hypothetical protein